MITKDTRLLTSLRTEYTAFLTSESKRRKTTKRAIIEDMFALYIEKKWETEMRAQYAQMEDDHEYISESRTLARNYLWTL